MGSSDLNSLKTFYSLSQQTLIWGSFDPFLIYNGFLVGQLFLQNTSAPVPCLFSLPLLRFSSLWISMWVFRNLFRRGKRGNLQSYQQLWSWCLVREPSEHPTGLQQAVDLAGSLFPGTLLLPQGRFQLLCPFAPVRLHRPQCTPCFAAPASLSWSCSCFLPLEGKDFLPPAQKALPHPPPTVHVPPHQALRGIQERQLSGKEFHL